MFDYLTSKRFLLIGVFPKKSYSEEILSEFTELQSLVNTYGGQVCAATYQKADYDAKATYIGTGKAQEATDTIAKEEIDIAVINDIIKPGQKFTLKKIFARGNGNIKVWDRLDLILRIFEKHANTAEANLQIKLADLKHMGPKLYGMGYILSRQGGGIGTRGIGQTNTEIMRRHWRDEIRAIRQKLDKLVSDRNRQIKQRQKQGIYTVSIIGYTNSGKTTLFNALSGKDKLVEDKLFATLDSATAKLYLPNLKKNIIISDTIGFIKNLPSNLIDSFKSTLLESINSDIILHVIDSADKELALKIKVVEELLADLNLQQTEKIFVFNKIDLIKKRGQNNYKKLYTKFNPVYISAKYKLGLGMLTTKLDKIFSNKKSF